MEVVWGGQVGVVSLAALMISPMHCLKQMSYHHLSLQHNSCINTLFAWHYYSKDWEKYCRAAWTTVLLVFPSDWIVFTSGCVYWSHEEIAASLQAEVVVGGTHDLFIPDMAPGPPATTNASQPGEAARRSQQIAFVAHSEKTHNGRSQVVSALVDISLMESTGN